MADAQHDDIDQQAIKAARETLSTCATRLDRYRAALDNGADPTVVSRWIADVQAEQVTAEATLRRLTGRRTMSPDKIRHIVEALGNITAVLRDADPADKALIYRELGLTPTYKPTARIVSAQATPSGSCTRLCPRPDTNRNPTRTTTIRRHPAVLDGWSSCAPRSRPTLPGPGGSHPGRRRAQIRIPRRTNKNVPLPATQGSWSETIPSPLPPRVT
jgi:hypothetical protein